MAHRRRELYEDRDARSSIWAGSTSSDAGYVGADWNGSIEGISLQTERAIRFKRRLLVRRRRPRMPRPRPLQRILHRPERLPAALLGDMGAPKDGRHEGCRLLRGPDPAVVGRRPQPFAHPRQHLRRQDRRRRAIATATVAEAGRPEGVVPGQQLLDPAPREPGQRRRLGHRPPLRQQPDHLEVPRRRRFAARTISRLQLLDAEMPRHLRHVRPRSCCGAEPTAPDSLRESSL
jgi:hypothetical protein